MLVSRFIADGPDVASELLNMFGQSGTTEPAVIAVFVIAAGQIGQLH
jgi:hypothetical protein